MDIFLLKQKKVLTGAQIKFPSISVGATENVIIAASLAKGITYLKNCACEPEIKNLTDFLNKMGANITWLGKREIKIIGCKKFKQQIIKLCLIELKQEHLL